MNRESSRIKDANKRRVLDDAARNRRLKKALEALEVDNYHDDPHADLGEATISFHLQPAEFMLIEACIIILGCLFLFQVMSKKVPKFSDSFETRNHRKKKGKGPDYYKQR